MRSWGGRTPWTLCHRGLGRKCSYEAIGGRLSLSEAAGRERSATRALSFQGAHGPQERRLRGGRWEVAAPWRSTQARTGGPRGSRDSEPGGQLQATPGGRVAPPPAAGVAQRAQGRDVPQGAGPGALAGRAAPGAPGARGRTAVAEASPPPGSPCDVAACWQGGQGSRSPKRPRGARPPEPPATRERGG